MAPPAFLASSFGYQSLLAQTDFTAVIASVSAMLLAQTPPWTNPSGNIFKSPVDGSSRFFDVTLTRDAATELHVIIRNESALVIADRKIDMDASTEIRVFAGQFHFCIEAVRAGIHELAGGGLLDLSPRPQNSHSNYVYGFGYRNAANTVDGGGGSSGQFTSIDNGTVAIADRIAHQTAPSLGAVDHFEASGFSEHTPAKLIANTSGFVRRQGRFYQHWMVPNTFADGAEIPIPIDVGATGVFKVLGRTPISGIAKLAIRKG